MTIPTYAGVVTSTGVGTSTSPDISTIASGSAPSVGDLIFVQVDRATASNTVDQHFNAPAGYHRHGAGQVGGAFVSAIFWKIRESGDSNTPTFSWGVSEAFICTVHCIRGTDQARPIGRATASTGSSSTTVTWTSDTTPVADCLVLAATPISGNRAGSSPPSGWTEVVDTQQTGGSKVTAYAMTQGFASSGSTASAVLTIGTGTGTAFVVPRLFFFQPPQTVTPRDVRVAMGTVTSPTATGTQNITGLGFDCKALIIYSSGVNTVGSVSNIAWSQGIGADDGVTTAAQRCIGFNVFQNVSGEGCKWVRNSNIVCVLLPGNEASPDLLASFSRITDGFSLNWTAVQATGYSFNYIALGGADFRAAVGAINLEGGSQAVTTLPWRPDFVHALSTFDAADADTITNGVSTTDNSYGWLDCQTGAQFCLGVNGATRTQIRDVSFLNYVNTTDVTFIKASTTGFSWNVGFSATARYMFYLACNVDAGGNSTYFPYQIELQRADASGTTNAVQTLPKFAVGQSTTAKKLVYQAIGLASTNPSVGAHSGGMGHTTFQGASATDTDALYYSYVSSTSQSRARDNVSMFSVPGKTGFFSTTETITWSTNDTVGRIIGLFTLGVIGQTYTVTAISDTVAVTDSIARGFVRVRSATDTAALTDSIAIVTSRARTATDGVVGTELFTRTATYGRAQNDSVAVTDSLARTVTRGRVVSDTVAVTDSLARTVTRGRVVSDTVAVTDSLKRTATYGRVAPLFRDSLSVSSDSIKRTATYARTIAEASTATDSLAREASCTRALSDSIAVVDSVALTITRGRTMADSVSVVDIVLAQQSTVVALSESVSVVDQVSPLLATTANDSIAVADQIAVQVTSTLAPIVDVASVSDLLNVEVAVATNDSIAIADSQSISVTATRTANDVVAITDAIVSSIARFVVATDTLFVVDGILAELTQGETSVSSSDSAAVADVIGLSRELGRVLSDAAAVADAVSVALTALRSVTDSVALVDQATAVGAYARAFVDSVTVSDGVTLKASFSVALADSISVVDQASASATIEATDVVATADLLSVSAVYTVAALSEAIALVDGAAAFLDRAVATSDAVVASDALSRDVSSARFATDNVPVIDALAPALVVARAITDAATVVDSVSASSDLAVATSEAAAVTDALSVSASLAVVFNDVTSVVDALQADVAGTAQQTVSDDIDVADALTRLASFVRSTSDTVTVADAVRVSEAESATAIDTVAIVDASLVELTLGHVVSDAVALVDAIARAYDAVRTLSDAVAVADVIAQGSVKLVDTVDAVSAVDAVSLALGYERRAADAVGIVDVVSRAQSTVRAALDSVALVDSLRTNQVKEVTTVDAVATFDAFALFVVYHETLDDVAAVTDLVSVAVDKGAEVTLSDTATATDSTALEFAYARASADTVATADDLTIEQIGYEVEASDAIDVADAIRLSTAVGKSLSDIIATPDVLNAQRTLGASEGGSSSDIVGVVDALFVDRPKLATDRAAAVDSLGVVVWFTRTAADAIDTEDSAFQGDLVFVPYGVDASVGPIIMSTIENGGPLSISGGPDLSPGPGPAVFVTRLGDVVDVTDRMIQGTSLAVEFTDSVEATG